jgi:hypothetical protein
MGSGSQPGFEEDRQIARRISIDPAGFCLPDEGKRSAISTVGQSKKLQEKAHKALDRL